MPHKFNESRRHHIPPAKYKVTNWPDYNKALEQRGNVTLWFNDHTIHNWYAKSNGQFHGQKRYSNSTIEAAALLRLVFHLPYRQTVGFIRSILKLMALELSVPNFSTLSRRIKKLGVRLSKPSEHKTGTHIIIDGSGLAVHGAKESFDVKGKQLEKHGFRRLHLSINEHQEITACELTTLHGNETKQVPKLLRKNHNHCECILADKNYDTKFVYDAIKKYRPARYIRVVKLDKYCVLIPPQSNAKIRKNRGKFPLERSRHSQYIKKHGVINWQKFTGYGERSLVEVCFSRYRKIIGKVMRCIKLKNQKVEARIACKALNRMLFLGMPSTVRVK